MDSPLDIEAYTDEQLGKMLRDKWLDWDTESEIPKRQKGMDFWLYLAWWLKH